MRQFSMPILTLWASANFAMSGHTLLNVLKVFGNTLGRVAADERIDIMQPNLTRGGDQVRRDVGLIESGFFGVRV